MKLDLPYFFIANTDVWPNQKSKMSVRFLLNHRFPKDHFDNSIILVCRKFIFFVLKRIDFPETVLSAKHHKHHLLLDILFCFIASPDGPHTQLNKVTSTYIKNETGRWRNIPSKLIYPEQKRLVWNVWAFLCKAMSSTWTLRLEQFFSFPWYAL